MPTMTVKEMNAEAQRLVDEGSRVIADPDNHTPEDIQAAIKSLEAADSFVQQITAATSASRSQEGERLKGMLAQFKRAAPRVGGDGNGIIAEGGRQEIKSVGRMFVDSDEFKGFLPGAGKPMLSYEVEGADFRKSLTSANAAFTSYDRQPGLISVLQQRLTVADLMPNGTTTAPTIRYPREVSYTNGALAVAEGAAKPEAAWSLAEVDAPVRKIAVIGSISEEMMDDFPYVQNYIDERLRFMVAQKEEGYLLTGTGTSPQITGILQTSGIQTVAKGASPDTNLNAIFRAITKIRAVGYMEPDAIVIHPNDYLLLRLAQDNQAQYYGGGPFTGAYGNGEMPVQPGIWGLKTVVTTAISSGTVLVGAFRVAAAIFRRMGIRVDMTNSNIDNFQNNLVTVRAEERLALCIYRPLGFCSVTAIA